MNEMLRTQLVATLAAANIDIRLSEDEVQDYPFVTYEMTVNPLRNKDGVYGFSGETYIRIVSEDFGTADTIRASVESAIESGMGMASTTFSSRLISVDKDCANTIWTIELQYLLKQFGEPEESEEDAGDPETPFNDDPENPVDPGEQETPEEQEEN